MRDSDLTERPGKGWTPWERGPGQVKIEAIWWDARALHFPKLNCSCWFSGSELVGIEHWDIAATNGACASRWTITRPYRGLQARAGADQEAWIESALLPRRECLPKFRPQGSATARPTPRRCRSVAKRKRALADLRKGDSLGSSLPTLGLRHP